MEKKSHLDTYTSRMSLMSKIDNIAQSYFPTFSGMFRKSSDKVPDTIPTDLQESIPKDVAISSQETLPKIRPEDGRKKPRTQKQIESYKKNFSKRHHSKNISLKPSSGIYEKIFSS